MQFAAPQTPSCTFHSQTDIFIDQKHSSTGPRFCVSIDSANLGANVLAEGITQPLNHTSDALVYKISGQWITDSLVGFIKTSEMVLISLYGRNIFRGVYQLGVKTPLSLP